MKQEDMRAIGKCFGSAVVGPRGQLVVPVEARRELGVEVGTRLLAFDLLQGRGVIFVKVEAVTELLSVVSERINEFTGALKFTETANIEGQVDLDL